jgi:C6 transcription factor Pro1
MNMYQLGYKQNLVYFNLAEKSRTILCEDLPLSEDEPTVTREVVSFRFLGSTMIWLDITSSITTGMTPYLLSHHSSALAPGSQVKLENIMGCKNWVMLQIGRISALHERKTQALRQGNFNCVEFEPIVADINREIQYGISQEAWERFNISEPNPAKDSNTLSDPTEVITNVFTSMGLIYLQLAIQGFQNLEILDATISAAVGTLKTQIPTHLLPALVAPLYVIGCVAKQEDEQFFRKIFSSSPLLDPSLKHRGRILPILQEIWAERRTTPGYSWEGSLELAQNMLLV